MSVQAGAQTSSPDESSPAESTAGALSPTSLARIRAALQADRRGERPGRTVFADPDAGWIVPPQPPVELAPGLGFIEGLGLYDDLTRGREPAPMGGPSHRAMMYQMTPREVTEALQTDVLGIGTASAFSGGLPYVVRKIAGWFSGSGSTPPARPVLTAYQEAAVLEDIRANTGVIDATLRQRGRTVTLSLLVPAGTEPHAARAIGERFVRLVARRAAEPGRGADALGEGAAGLNAVDLEAEGSETAGSEVADPGVRYEDAVGDDDANAIGPGAFDYVISVRSPADTVIARGGKATNQGLVRW